jgi:spore coat protein A
LYKTRRTFLQQASALSLGWGAAHALPAQQGSNGNMPRMAMPAGKRAGAEGSVRNPPMLHSLQLPPFVDPLPLPHAARFSSAAKGSPRTSRIAMREVYAKVHRDLSPTRQWAYVDANAPAANSALAPLIDVRANEPVRIQWLNELPRRHFLPIDYSLHGCGHHVPEVRAIVHVHGARVPPADDGYPTDWFVAGHSRTGTFPLEQDGATLWYHDHAMGINRLNIYAGLFGNFLIRDAAEDALHLPTGAFELPLLIYDRDFTADAQLFYPTSGDPDHPWVPEFNADAILINGKIRPFVKVEPRLYRLRLVNAANSRFFRLSIACPAQASHQTAPLPLHQIGSDQGLLSAPVEMTALSLAPAERADVLIDLSACAGQYVHLRNGAFDILEFRVAPHVVSSETHTIPKALRTIEPPMEASAMMTRTITLNEYQDGIGDSMEMLLNRKHWHAPVTERPRLNTTEIWEFVNLTEDTHPMHLHLVRFQILDRRPFDTFAYLMQKQLAFTGAAVKPDANEAGWKDVVQCAPGCITRILVKYEGYTGNYLYHCHILEHEANDMMRPFEVIA